MSFKNISSLFLCIFSAYCSYYLFIHRDRQEQQIAPDKELPLFSSSSIKTTSYDIKGLRNYSLESLQLEHFQSTDETHFEKPQLYTFETGVNKAWRVLADKAILKDKHILEMTGNVNLYNLLPDAQLKKITSEKITLNLTSRDFWSNSETQIFGVNFNTRGLRAKGNFDTHTMELIEKVNTVYESEIN